MGSGRIPLFGPMTSIEGGGGGGGVMVGVGLLFPPLVVSGLLGGGLGFPGVGVGLGSTCGLGSACKPGSACEIGAGCGPAQPAIANTNSIARCFMSSKP